VAGTFAFASPSLVPGVVGAQLASVTFVPANSANYNTVSGSVSVVVNGSSRQNISSASAAAIPNKTYTGKALKPSVKLTYGGKMLRSGTDYTLAYSSNTTSGKAKITVTGTGDFTGTKTVYFKIVPKKSAVSKVKAGSKKLTVSWKKHSAASGYQVAYSKKKSSGFKNAPATSKASKTVTKLKKGTRYYVKVRAYKTIDGKKVYGAWSNVKSAKTK
jgi:hypothetical protein